MLDLSTPSLPANANASIAQTRSGRGVPGPLDIRFAISERRGRPRALSSSGQRPHTHATNDKRQTTNDRRAPRTQSFALSLSCFICMRSQSIRDSCRRERRRTVGRKWGMPLVLSRRADAKREGRDGTGDGLIDLHSPHGIRIVLLIGAMWSGLGEGEHEIHMILGEYIYINDSCDIKRIQYQYLKANVNAILCKQEMGWRDSNIIAKCGKQEESEKARLWGIGRPRTKTK
ncbi:hypothetical protein C8F01DRAFT_173598 [Mycena amicta]|nr:hypothetical protein C8F01DRAFT_173598 [Mycena amicta]